MSETELLRLEALRSGIAECRKAITDCVQAEGRTHLTERETEDFNRLTASIQELDERIEDVRADLERSGRTNPFAIAARKAQARVAPDGTPGGDAWATRAATALQRMGGEERSITSGSVDVPSMLTPAVTEKARPARLIDVLTTRQTVEGNVFEYFRQSVRTNNAAMVPDGTEKPTSVFTVEPVTDRVRVLAHLSEAVPQRLLADHQELSDWLEAEMTQGLLDALEAQVIRGTGIGENLAGLTTITGTTAVTFDSRGIAFTLRKARTALQNAGEVPNALVINPATAEALDLATWQVTGAGEEAEAAGWQIDGFTNGTAASGNILGGNEIQRIVSPSIPAGVAVLGDWTKAKLVIREDMRLDIDVSGENFTHNTAVLRAEMRVGLAFTRPSAFAKIALA